MSVENLTSVVTDPYHVTDPEHGFTVHDPETVAFVSAPVFPATAPEAQAHRPRSPAPRRGRAPAYPTAPKGAPMPTTMKVYVVIPDNDRPRGSHRIGLRRTGCS